MDLNKYTQKAQEAIIGAQALARDHNHQAIEPAHLLLALLNQTESTVPAVGKGMLSGSSLPKGIRKGVE